MIAIIAFVVFLTLGIILICYVNRRNKSDLKETVLLSIGCLCIATATVGALIFDACFAAACLKTTKTSEVVGQNELLALSDHTTAATGSFFLGCGSVGEKEYYIMYISTENGYKRIKLNANSSDYPIYIKYISSSETPRIEQYSLVERNTLVKEPNIWLSLIGYCSFSNHDIGDVVSEETKSSLSANRDNYRYVIYIPEGSIKQDYNIDME